MAHMYSQQLLGSIYYRGLSNYQNSFGVPYYQNYSIICPKTLFYKRLWQVALQLMHVDPSTVGSAMATPSVPKPLRLFSLSFLWHIWH